NGQVPFHDAVVIGSGFGGSVSALRLAEKGHSVLVLERGRRFADADFPRTTWHASRYLWLPSLRCLASSRSAPSATSGCSTAPAWAAAASATPTSSPPR